MLKGLRRPPQEVGVGAGLFLQSPPPVRRRSRRSRYRGGIESLLAMSRRMRGRRSKPPPGPRVNGATLLGGWTVHAGDGPSPSAGLNSGGAVTAHPIRNAARQPLPLWFVEINRLSVSGEVRTMGTLSAERCVACRRDSPRVTEAEIAELTREVPDWRQVERDGVARLERVFHFPSFADALAFTNRVGALAEADSHHPALLTEWGRVTVTWWTQKIRGLHRNDFVMAAKTDALVAESAHVARGEIREGRAL